MSAVRARWEQPHTLEDILDQAPSPEAAAPREIRVRSEVYARLRRERAEHGGAVTADADGQIRSVDGIPLVVDGELPPSPGYEIHRAAAERQDRAA